MAQTCQITLNEAMQMSSRRLVDYIHYLGFELPNPPQNGKWGKGQLVQFAMQFAATAALNGCTIVKTMPSLGRSISVPSGVVGGGGGGGGVGPWGSGIQSPFAPAFAQTPQQPSPPGTGTTAMVTLPIGPQMAPSKTIPIKTQPIIPWMNTSPISVGMIIPLPLPIPNATTIPEYNKLIDKYWREINTQKSINPDGTLMQRINIPMIRELNDVNDIAVHGVARAVLKITPKKDIFPEAGKVVDYSGPLESKSAKTVRACSSIPSGAVDIINPKDYSETWKKEKGILLKGCITHMYGTEDCTKRMIYLQFINGMSDILKTKVLMEIYTAAMQESKSIAETVHNYTPYQQFFLDAYTKLCDADNFGSIFSLGNSIVLQVMIDESSYNTSGNVSATIFSMKDFMKNQLPLMDVFNNPKGSIFEQIYGAIGLIISDLGFNKRDLTGYASKNYRDSPVFPKTLDQYGPLYYYHSTFNMKDFVVVLYGNATISVYLLPRPYEMDITIHDILYPTDENVQYTINQPPNITQEQCKKWVDDTMNRILTQFRDLQK